MEYKSFVKVIQLINSTDWNLDYIHFCNRTGFRLDDDYSTTKWQEWRKLASALSQFDVTTLARICGVNNEPLWE